MRRMRGAHRGERLGSKASESCSQKAASATPNQDGPVTIVSRVTHTATESHCGGALRGACKARTVRDGRLDSKASESTRAQTKARGKPHENRQSLQHGEVNVLRCLSCVGRWAGCVWVCVGRCGAQREHERLRPQAAASQRLKMRPTQEAQGEAACSGMGPTVAASVACVDAAW